MKDKIDKRTKEYRASQKEDEGIQAFRNSTETEPILAVAESEVFTKLDGGKAVVCCFRHSPCSVHRPTGPLLGYLMGDTLVQNCCDPHNEGCSKLLKSPSTTVQQACEECVWKNAGKRVG